MPSVHTQITAEGHSECTLANKSKSHGGKTSQLTNLQTTLDQWRKGHYELIECNNRTFIERKCEERYVGQSSNGFISPRWT